MRIVIGSDHAGLSLKHQVIPVVEGLGHECIDFGTHTEASCDYPDIGIAVANEVAARKATLGILICGTGIGMSMTANKVPGIRAALCSDTFSARASREHNDANILCLGARVIGPGVAADIVTVWLQADFAGGRHTPRVEKMARLEGRSS